MRRVEHQPSWEKKERESKTVVEYYIYNNKDAQKKRNINCYYSHENILMS